MKLIDQPEQAQWSELQKRPSINTNELDALIDEIFSTVKVNGDEALRSYTQKFDGVSLTNFLVTDEEISYANTLVDKELKSAIEIAYKNIFAFHEAQKPATVEVETMPGVKCWQMSVPIEKIGVYIPGGSAPLFSTILMLCIPAIIAECKRIVLCTPPNEEGEVNPVILYVANKLKIKEIYKIGGAQAIAAMTYGTDSIPRVDKVFGPGNQYVTAAKQFAQLKGLAIDMPAGPSELLVMADISANPAFVAADLLSQAEHGEDSQVICLSDDKEVLNQIMEQVKVQLNDLPRKQIAMKSLENSRFIYLKSINEMMDFSNSYAPEHLIINRSDAQALVNRVCNAGSVFIGPYTPESAGDYASGTNHTLPTNGFARMYSGVNLDSFCKKITYQSINEKGILNIGPAIEEMAKAEELIAHKNAVSIRLKYLKS